MEVKYRITHKESIQKNDYLRNLHNFDLPQEALINIYILYIRSVVEQSAVIWNSSITKGEKKDLERVQKVALQT